MTSYLSTHISFVSVCYIVLINLFPLGIINPCNPSTSKHFDIWRHHKLIPSNCELELSLCTWRYCVCARLKFWRRSRVPKKGSRDGAVFLAASPLVTAPPIFWRSFSLRTAPHYLNAWNRLAPPPNLIRLYYNGSAAKSHSTTTQYRQLRRLNLTVLVSATSGRNTE